MDNTWHRGIDLDAKLSIYNAQRHPERVCIFYFDQDMTLQGIVAKVNYKVENHTFRDHYDR